LTKLEFRLERDEFHSRTLRVVGRDANTNGVTEITINYTGDSNVFKAVVLDEHIIPGIITVVNEFGQTERLKQIIYNLIEGYEALPPHLYGGLDLLSETYSAAMTELNPDGVDEDNRISDGWLGPPGEATI
jgi:hypothetical protein